MPINYRDELDRIVRERILILDGGMGSIIQGHRLSETDFRGTEFASHPVPLAGCNDILCLTKPELISSIHEAYLEAGADIITTCSFNATAVSLADYDLAGRSYDISRAAGALARQAAERFSTPEKPRFAAGSMGPTAKSAGIAQDINDPGKRGVSWDQLEAAYYENARGLLDGGVHLIVLETIFDTLNAKAAIAALIRLREERNAAIPLIISATVSAAGRLLSGQTVEAFAVSVSHGEPFALGLNCSMGAEKMLPHISALSAFTPFPVCCYPNAGFPDQSGVYRQGPEEMAALIKPFFEQGLVNIAGGCCGTTPAHIAAIAELAKSCAPRKCGGSNSDGSSGGSSGSSGIGSGGSNDGIARTFLAGLEVLPLPGTESGGVITIDEGITVGEDQTIFECIKNNDIEDAVDLVSDMIEDGAEIINLGLDGLCVDGGFPNAKAAIVSFLNTALFDPSIARVPILFSGSNGEILETALKCVQGKSLVNSLSFNENDFDFLRRAAHRYGAAITAYKAE